MPTVPRRVTALLLPALLLTTAHGTAIYPGAAGGASVASWNAAAYEIGFAEDSFRTFKALRAFAMMHIAMHDAVNGAVPRYRQHTFHGRDPGAAPPAAAAQAAHDILSALYPASAVRLDSLLQRALQAVPDAESRARGVALGRQAARHQLSARQGDGWDAPGAFTFRTGPGFYRSTPPWNGFVLQPGFRSARGFAITAPSQFRPPPPPVLASPAYATAFDEVKRVGGREGGARSSDEAGYAIWWMEYVEGSLNRLARRLAEEQGLSLHDAARLFALLNMSLYDTYIAVWDSKFEFAHWRPYSAIREAGGDGNPATAPDSSWESLRPAPPFPEYVSAHAAACAAVFVVLRRELGGTGPFTFGTLSAPEGMQSRTFDSFDDAAEECADSRIRLGWHFRYATDAGLELGRAVATYTVNQSLDSLFPSAP